MQFVSQTLSILFYSPGKIMLYLRITPVMLNLPCSTRSGINQLCFQGFKLHVYVFINLYWGMIAISINRCKRADSELTSYFKPNTIFPLICPSNKALPFLFLGLLTSSHCMFIFSVFLPWELLFLNEILAILILLGSEIISK